LSIELSAEIVPEKTLIIFDEIQECTAALNSLKYLMKWQTNIIFVLRDRF